MSDKPMNLSKDLAGNHLETENFNLNIYIHALTTVVGKIPDVT